MLGNSVLWANYCAIRFSDGAVLLFTNKVGILFWKDTLHLMLLHHSPLVRRADILLYLSNVAYTDRLDE